VPVYCAHGVSEPHASGYRGQRDEDAKSRRLCSACSPAVKCYTGTHAPPDRRAGISGRVALGVTEGGLPLSSGRCVGWRHDSYAHRRVQTVALRRKPVIVFGLIRSIRIFGPMLLVLAGLLTSIAQDMPPVTPDASVTEALKKEKLPEKVAALGDLRRRLLLRDKPKAEQELQNLRRMKEEAEVVAARLQSVEKDLQEAETQKDTTLTARLRRLRDDLKARSARLERVADDDLKSKEAQLAEYETSLTEIERTIDKLLDPEVAKQNFKLYMSLTFAVLVALVIGGTFAMANKDEEVRRVMFSGQAGIQFVTLFSLVIAIILFGITAILEGKELSALLGGLSGYILGRTTSEARQTTP
jgi:hypothetical protein